MTTKPDTETGWTKAAPERNGYYWWRMDKDGDADPCQVRDGRVFDFGDRDSVPLQGLGGEWLGPISSADFEQLIQLRKAAQDAEKFLAWWCESTDANPPRSVGGAMAALTALREALTDTGEQS